RLKVGRVDLGPGHGEVQRAFAVFVRVARGGQADVGNHALVLGGAADNAIELRHGQLELAKLGVFAARHVVEVDQVLDGALAEGRLADDHAAAVVLDGGSEDLRGR